MTDEQPIDVVRASATRGARGPRRDRRVLHRRRRVPQHPAGTGGRPDQIRATIEGFSGGVEKIEFRVDDIAADGGTVLTERHDIFTFANGEIDLP